jgi:glycosyltransferase involved in cell wall biosynthesis
MVYEEQRKLEDVLLITWHGIHELDIFPGLPDTGGQNIYVHNMAEMIHDNYGCRVIILNRGGYTHPYTERMREGMSKDPDRELYVLHVADDIPAFLRKEYLTGALIEQASANVHKFLPRDYDPDLIISHFWDGGLMGLFLRRSFPEAPHVWVPHEPVGLKMAPLPDTHHERHSIPERERFERMVVKDAHAIGSTSKLVYDDLLNSYGDAVAKKIIDIYPGVNTRRFSPLTEPLDGSVIRHHAEFLNLPEELFRKPHICEFGRSDSLKDKDKAVEAFAKAARQIGDLHMFVNLDEVMEPEIGRRIREIVASEQLEERVHILSPEQLPQNGNGSDIMPNLLKTSHLFLTMSVMEGFGMAACEAAACRVPVIGTDQIPVVTDNIAPEGGGRVVAGKDVDAAAKEIIDIVSLPQDQYDALCERAYRSVIPRYRWDTIVDNMFVELENLDLNYERRMRLMPEGAEEVQQGQA